MSLRPILAAAAALVPSLAAAQAAPRPAAPTPVPASPSSAVPVPTTPAIPLDRLAAALTPGSWTWTLKMTPAGQAAQDFGSRTLTLARGAAPAQWLIVDAQQNPMSTASDTIVVAAADLATVRRALAVKTPMGDVRMAMQFTADSVTGKLEAPGQTQPIAMRNVPDALANDGLLLVSMGKLPLAAGWSGRLNIVNPQGGTVSFTYAVTGQEKVTVPAGTFDAWKVEMSGPASATLYVARGGPVVRIVQAVPQMGGASIEGVLAK